MHHPNECLALPKIQSTALKSTLASPKENNVTIPGFLYSIPLVCKLTASILFETFLWKFESFPIWKFRWYLCSEVFMDVPNFFWLRLDNFNFGILLKFPTIEVSVAISIQFVHLIANNFVKTFMSNLTVKADSKCFFFNWWTIKKYEYTNLEFELTCDSQAL